MLDVCDRRGFYQAEFDEWRSRYVGVPVPVDFRAVTGSSSAVDRLTHLIHPYPAKLLAAIPQFFLACEGLVGSKPKLLDPFCGSGTVLLEGLVAGSHVTGADVNPLARSAGTRRLIRTAREVGRPNPWAITRR